MCKEEPFISIKLPIRDADASVVHAFGDLTNGQQAIIVKVVDNGGKLYFFAILNDGPEGKYKTVLKNIPLSWNDEYGVANFADISRDGPIPSVFFTSSDFEKVFDSYSAICDLKTFLKEKTRIKTDRRDFAYQILSKRSVVSE